MTYSRSNFASEHDVSRETLTLFTRWHDILSKWNRRINLVSASAMDSFWERHALDSWQVNALITTVPRRAIDLGSGAGFPGIAVGIGLKQAGQGRVRLVESAGKKATFLRTVARELDLPVDVTSERAEKLAGEPMDLVTARAFAPLPRLLDYAAPFWSDDTLGLLLKGEGVDAELSDARKTWNFELEIHPSRSSKTGKILAIRNLSPIPAA